MKLIFLITVSLFSVGGCTRLAESHVATCPIDLRDTYILPWNWNNEEWETIPMEMFNKCKATKGEMYFKDLVFLRTLSDGAASEAISDYLGQIYIINGPSWVAKACDTGITLDARSKLCDCIQVEIDEVTAVHLASMLGLELYQPLDPTD